MLTQKLSLDNIEDSSKNLKLYLQECFKKNKDAFFRDSDYFYELIDLNVMVPYHSRIIVERQENPSLIYLVSNDDMLSLQSAKVRGGVVSLQERISTPYDALEGRLWIVSNLNYINLLD